MNEPDGLLLAEFESWLKSEDIDRLRGLKSYEQTEAYVLQSSIPRSKASLPRV